MIDAGQSFAGLSLVEKRMLLAELLREKVNQDASVFPLAHGQRGLWFLYQMDRTNAAYHVFFPCRIRSHLDVPAWRRAFQALMDRHPTLRATFEECHGELVQRIHDNLPVWFEVSDASAWSEETLRLRLEEEVHRPFDLEHGPLIRMHLFRRTPDEHVFLVTAHHIIGDFWSLVVLMEDMHILYPAELQKNGKGKVASTDDASVLPPPSSHYRDFVQWQADLLAGSEGEQLWSFWKQRLAGVPPVLDLPTDRPRPPRFTHRGGDVPYQIRADLTQRLKTLAAGEQATLYTVLLAAFQVVLGRHAGQDDFVIGSPFAGRSRSEFERVVGYFVNMLPLRVNLSGNPSFRELLRQTSATVLEALQHQDYPFLLLVERLNLKRDLSRAPLVQVSFTLEKSHKASQMGALHFMLPQAEVRLNVGALQIEPFYVRQQTCQIDLELVLEEGQGTIDGILRYNTDLFHADTIRRLAEHYQAVLAGVVNDPDSRLSDLALLTPAEERLVLYDWNDTEIDCPRDICLHQLFEQQVAKTPTAVALCFGERSLSYAELDAWANQIAHRLHRLGIGRQTLVALCIDRSLEMVAAILAVLKAGAAYVPLDPASPPERLKAILADTRAPVLLTQRQQANRFDALTAKVIGLDVDEAELSVEKGAEAARPPVSGVRPSDLAYVIYTSGSTGQPKGVMVEHRAICNTIVWRRQALSVYEDDRLILTIPYFFDASLCILFPALTAGAQLILPEPGAERDPFRLLEHIGRDGVTGLVLLPKLLQLLMEGPIQELGQSLRWVGCGGEAMSPDLPHRLFNLLNVRLYNLYGPTEAAVEAVYWNCQRGDNRPSIPIGRPIANVQVYVLDQYRQPAPVGTPGELYIGGSGLARGYLNDPQLTAERFLSHPWSNVPGSRLYRTGDRCRWLADGSLEFLGRLDQQVKIRGCRIELGEIEAALSSHPAVREAVVATYNDVAAEHRLAAYVVAQVEADPPAVQVLRSHLKERLPEYMVPSSFVYLPALPRSPTGKLDRQALPPPLNERRLSGQSYVAPATQLERFLAELWRDLLRVEKVGVLDNFFELGGDSIQAALLIHRLQESLGRPIYTVALFDAPTIAELARYLIGVCPETIVSQFGPASLAPKETGKKKEENKQRHNPDASLLLVTLQPQGTRPPCFLVHPPGGIVVCYQALAQRLGRERPCYGIRARGLNREMELPTQLEDMAAEYVAAIRAVQTTGPYHIAGWSMGGIIALEMAQQLRADGQPVGLLALLDTTIPLNPANQGFTQEVEQSGREYGLDVSLEELARLGPNEQLPYLWQHVQKLGLVETDTPLPLVQQILDDLKRLFHAHIQMANDYVVRHYPGQITLFRPTQSHVPVSTSADRGWGNLADAVEVHFVPGQHHTMVKEPHVQVLAQQLRSCLKQVEDALQDITSPLSVS